MQFEDTCHDEFHTPTYRLPHRGDRRRSHLLRSGYKPGAGNALSPSFRSSSAGSATGGTRADHDLGKRTGGLFIHHSSDARTGGTGDFAPGSAGASSNSHTGADSFCCPSPGADSCSDSGTHLDGNTAHGHQSQPAAGGKQLSDSRTGADSGSCD